MTEKDLHLMIFNILEIQGPMTRKRLSNILGIPMSTLHENLTQMVAKNIIRFKSVKKRKGRPEFVFYVP